MILKKIPLEIYILIIAFFLLSSYTFNSKLDLNGDNANYYIYAKSLATGHGYSDLSSPGNPATANFPPGYSILMAPLFWFTESIIVQNYLGEIFLLGSLILFYLFVVTNCNNKGFAFFIASVILMNFFILQFATMMMSELPFIFFTIATIILLQKNETQDNNKLIFFVFIFLAVFTYHIRTQGIVLLGSILIHYLFAKKWKKILFSIVGFAIGMLPWIIRNNLLKLQSNRYLSQLMLVDQLNPEKGNLSFAEIFSRFLLQSWDVISKELPRTFYSFFIRDYASNIFYPILGVIIFVIIIYGAWKFIKLRWFLLSFVLGNFFIIGIWSGKGFENRYLICILPILLFCFYFGITSIIKAIFKFEIKQYYVWMIASFFMLLIQFKEFKFLNEFNTEEYPEAYANLINVAEWTKENLPDSGIVSVRKPSLFYLFSNKKSLNYLYSSDPDKVIANMVDNKIDYVVLDALEYSTTTNFLIPAIRKYINQFQQVYVTGKPEFYLLKFNKNEEVKK